MPQQLFKLDPADFYPLILARQDGGIESRIELDAIEAMLCETTRPGSCALTC